MTDSSPHSIAREFFEAAAYAGNMIDFEGLKAKLQATDEAQLASTGYKAVGDALSSIAVIGQGNAQRPAGELKGYREERAALEEAINMFISETYDESPVTGENRDEFQTFLDNLAGAAHTYGRQTADRSLPMIYGLQRNPS